MGFLAKDHSPVDHLRGPRDITALGRMLFSFLWQWTFLLRGFHRSNWGRALKSLVGESEDSGKIPTIRAYIANRDNSVVCSKRHKC
jgi:hypothetical protein